MELQTSYELRIPEDSVASTATDGILGETYLGIDVSRASGPPILSGGRLPSKESAKFTAAILDRAVEAVKLLKQMSDEEKKSSAQATRTNSTARPSPKPSPSPVPK
jgi:ABC-type transporter Mla subunit MlaD